MGLENIFQTGRIFYVLAEVIFQSEQKWTHLFSYHVPAVCQELLGTAYSCYCSILLKQVFFVSY